MWRNCHQSLLEQQLQFYLENNWFRKTLSSQVKAMLLEP